MPNPSFDPDMIKAVMSLVGGVLAFVSTISAIVHNRLQKARNVAQREQIIARLLIISQVLFCVVGIVLLTVFDLSFLSLWFFLAACAVSFLSYIRSPFPASRGETAFLVLVSTATFFLFGAHFISRIVVILEKIVGVLPPK